MRLKASLLEAFVEDARALSNRTPEQWQQDAFGQISALLCVMTLLA